ncbi:hypothetical protein BDY19DRAFT_936573 [Irpex rosettiformis]|uniref:Uncharacterized protein n=1 Tax=Irpex rosettiformis TaxID=378272 RepID=A0ACB8U8D9_9APHY|nr:hypothetical protein BDY19DRAFT_936573 [Irpex rosettiformis]
MSDFNLVDPRGWEYDLQSVYSAYMGHFQLHNIPWYERTWGVFFESFEEFLTFSWPVITVTDCWTGKAHIVTRMTSIGAFLKMIKTRFGETLPVVDNMQRVTPFETSQRHMRTITDYALYKKLYSTLPAAVLASLRIRVRDGEPRAIRDLWDQREKTFVAIDFEWSERNASSCLEWGYAAARCAHLEAVGIWPPDPDANYRRGHYIVSEYIDKQHNKHRPNFPWAYAFGDSQVTLRAKLPQIMQAIFSTMTSPDSETSPSTLVLVGHGISSDIKRMEEMRIKIPHNVLIIDIALFERHLFAAGHRGPMSDPTGKPRAQGTALSLPSLLQSLGLDVQPPLILNNSGNDAFLILLAFQLLLSPDDTKIPNLRGRSVQQTVMRNVSRSPVSLSPSAMAMGMGMGMGGMMPMYGMPSMMPMSMPMMAPLPPSHTPSPVLFPQLSPVAGGAMTPSPSRSPKMFHDSDSRRSSGSYFPHSNGVPDNRPRKPSGLVPSPTVAEHEVRQRKISTNGSGSGSGSGSGPSSSGENGLEKSKSETGVDEAAKGLGNFHI